MSSTVPLPLWASTRTVVAVHIDGKTLPLVHNDDDDDSSHSPPPIAAAESILRRRCRVCGCDFATVAEHRAHFSTPQHLSAVSSVADSSGSSDESDDSFSSSSSSEEEEEESDAATTAEARTPMVVFECADGERRCVVRTVVEALSGAAALDTSSAAAAEQTAAAAALFLAAARRAAAPATVQRGVPREGRWCVLLCRSGFFAGAVFEAGKPVLHRTFRRYTARRKQGGSQSAHDSKSHAKSAGAAIRRHHEKRYVELVHDVLREWADDLSRASCGLVLAALPRVQRQGKLLFFEGSPLEEGDTRIRRVPFTTGRPSFAECVEVFNRSWMLQQPAHEEAAVAMSVPPSTPPQHPRNTKESIEEASPEAAAVKAASLGNAGKLRESMERLEMPPSQSFLSEALVAACSAGSLQCVEVLLKKRFGADPNSFGALHAAARSGNEAVVRLLISRGADATAKDTQGKTALQVCTSDGARAALAESPQPQDDEARRKAKREKAKARAKARKAAEKEQERAEAERKKVAAEKRAAKKKEKTSTAPPKPKPQPPAQTPAPAPAPVVDGVACFFCGKEVERSTSFEQMGNKFCSIVCVLANKKVQKK